MNVNNFGSLDFGNMLNRRQNEWNQTLNGVSQMGDAFNTYYDRKQAEDDRKRKWDAILDIEKQGNEALQADDNYNNSVAKQKELQGYIDTNNKANQEFADLQKQYDDTFEKRSRIARSQTRHGVMSGNNYIPYEDLEKKYHMNMNYNNWNNPMVDVVGNPYDKKLDELYEQIGDRKPVSNEGLEWKLQQEQERGLNYRKAGQNADMYRDPRYQVALATAKANGDPTALNQYVQQWSAEAPQRDSYNTMKGIAEIPFDVSGYGETAKMLQNAVRTAKTPQEQSQYMSMLFGYISQIDANKIAKADEREQRINDNKFAIAMHDFNNKNWTIADLGNKYRDVDLTTLDPREVQYIQKMLKVPPTGKVGNKTIQAMQKAVAEGDVLNETMKKLYTEFDAKNVLGAISESNRQKQFEEFMKYNAYSGNDSGSGW